MRMAGQIIGADGRNIENGDSPILPNSDVPGLIQLRDSFLRLWNRAKAQSSRIVLDGRTLGRDPERGIVEERNAAVGVSHTSEPSTHLIRDDLPVAKSTLRHRARECAGDID